jgi:hypothetical protein
MRPPRWISPWSFDDEWEDEQKRHAAANRLPTEVQKKAAATQATALPAEAPAVREVPKAVNMAEISARSVTAPAIVSLREAANPVEAQKSHDRSTNVAPSLPESDLDERFRPPSSGDLSVVANNHGPDKAQRTKLKSVFDPPEIKTSDPPTTPQKRPAPVPNSARQRSEARFPWGTIFTSILGVAGIFLLGSIYLIDAPPANDDDLRLKVPVDTAAKIAGPERLSIFLQGVNALPDLEMARKPVWLWETPFLQSFILGNGAALDALRDLLGDFDWHPHHAAWHQQDLGEHIAWPHVRILLQARVAYLLRLGEDASALSAALDLGHLSSRLQHMWSWPSYSQRSQELHMACVQVTALVLKKTRLSSAELKLFQEDFMRLMPRDDLLQGALTAMYLHQKKLIFGENSGLPLDTMPSGVLLERPGRLFFKKQETLSLFAAACRHLRDQIVEAPFSVGTARRLPFGRPRAAFSFQPNGAGQSYFAEHFNAVFDLPERHHLARVRHSLVQSLFAIRRYLADHQKLPSGLTDLLPDYLAEISIDPYSGEPLHYDPLKGLLFSVGNDFRSGNGRVTEPPLSDDAEPTVELGVAVASAQQAGQ